MECALPSVLITEALVHYGLAFTLAFTFWFGFQTHGLCAANVNGNIKYALPSVLIEFQTRNLCAANANENVQVCNVVCPA